MKTKIKRLLKSKTPKPDKTKPKATQLVLNSHSPLQVLLDQTISIPRKNFKTDPLKQASDLIILANKALSALFQQAEKECLQIGIPEFSLCATPSEAIYARYDKDGEGVGEPIRLTEPAVRLMSWVYGVAKQPAIAGEAVPDITLGTVYYGAIRKVTTRMYWVVPVEYVKQDKKHVLCVTVFCDPISGSYSTTEKRLKTSLVAGLRKPTKQEIESFAAKVPGGPDPYFERLLGYEHDHNS